MNTSHKKRFSELSPESTVTALALTGKLSGPVRGNRTALRRWMIVTLVVASVSATVLLVIGSLGSRSAGGHDHLSAVRAAHGPIATADGVPVGYAHDRAGAETAAVNALQALTQAGLGRIPMAAVERAVVARDPGPGLRRSLRIGADRAPDGDVVNLVPAAVSTVELSVSSARVSIWTVAVSRSSIGGDASTSVITAWATHTLSLVWEASDWKAKELTSQTGPTPAQTVAPGSQSPLSGALESGYYSFYIN